MSDPTRLYQILMNLAGNAVKFTEKGRVSLTIEGVTWSHPLNTATLQFKVTDTGIGIPPEKITTIFDSFQQAGEDTTARFGGTGLGLTIARRMANIMGGDITVTSKLAEGSCFTLEIEAEVVEWAKPVAAAEVHAEIEGGESLRVLVVEDHPVNRMILEAWMSTASHVTATAENGRR
jgi:K+-sensing histidine kinase KdpD